MQTNNNLKTSGSDVELTSLSLIQELRIADSTEEGIIEGYVAVWNTVDSYNSRFQKGSFKQTLNNRKDKIRVLWNHDTEQPIGKLLDIQEDDHGVFVRAQLIMDVDKAKETFALIRGGAIDCFSFGFRIMKDKYENGIQVITEVLLGEISPVVFEANPASQITGIRSTDFLETVDGINLAQEGYKLFTALDITLDDIWWNNTDENISENVDKALNDFSEQYRAWTQKVVDVRSGGVRMDVGFGNELSKTFRQMCLDKEETIETIAQNSSLTVDELRALKSGKLIDNAEKLKILDEQVFKVHNEQKSKAVETLCSELRGGLNPAEAIRLKALLSKSLPEKEHEVEDAVAYLSNFREKLNEDF